ncbi:hypothetical protein, partial [Novipirellula herctigrandis]|uniref:hypothetical protein n=1 Tax=Novipirellula herctigrandis TaxID=2527986 RepID=UPI003AF36481
EEEKGKGAVFEKRKRGRGRFSGLGLIFSSEYDQSFFSQLMVCQESNVPMKQAVRKMTPSPFSFLGLFPQHDSFNAVAPTRETKVDG